MAAAAALIAPVLGFLLLKPLLTTVARSSDALTRAKGQAATAKRKAAAAEQKAKTTAEKLQAARELAERQERELAKRAEAPPAPPAPPEPPLYDVQIGDAEIRDKPPASKPASKADTVEKLGQEQPTKRQWAEGLYAYASREIREGRSSNLGSKGAPNARVREAQAGMGKLTADGIYGDKTRARGKELLGKDFPARRTAAPKQAAPQLPAPAPAPKAKEAPPAPPEPKAAPKATPAKRSPIEAAEALLAYAKDAIADGASSRFGTKAAPSAFVQAAQADMGKLTADGIYGPATRARGKELTGKTFPARA